jgi:sporulation protein YlmC with PRC-barrel domain
MKPAIHYSAVVLVSLGLLASVPATAAQRIREASRPPRALPSQPGQQPQAGALPAKTAGTPIQRVPDLAQSLLSSHVEGLKVRDRNGKIIGEIDQLIIDRSGRITHVVLGTGGVLGFGETHYVVPWSAVHIAKGRDYARLDAAKSQLKSEFAAFEPTKSSHGSGSEHASPQRSAPAPKQ